MATSLSVFPTRYEATLQTESVVGSERTAARILPAQGSFAEGSAVETGMTRERAALPGLQTSRHMSQRTAAFISALEPVGASLEGVIVTGKSRSPSYPLPITSPCASTSSRGAGHLIAPAFHPCGRVQAISVARPVPGLDQ